MDSSANYLGMSAPEQGMNMSRKDLDFIDKHMSRPQNNNYEDIISIRVPGGVEVGRYNPKYFEVDKKVPTKPFHQYDFLTDAEREKLK